MFHSAVDIGKNQMLIFGGQFNSKIRFNDSYILRTAPNFVWFQPPNQKSGAIPQNQESKIGAPEPRSHHSSIYIKENNKVYIFGGYGGANYRKKTFNDLYSIDCDNFEWITIEPIGLLPEPRLGHIAVNSPNQRGFLIHGGWSIMSQFNNCFFYNYEINQWSEIDIPFGTPRWNHSSLLINSLPESKLFIFSGSQGFFEEGAERNFGYFSNQLQYINITKDLKNQKMDTVTSTTEVIPAPRESCQMIYDQVEQRILIFGGWNNDILNDIYEINISSIVGPEYAVYSIHPNLGPLTGNTNCTLIGEGFKQTLNFYVRFSYGKYFQDVQAQFVSETEMTCKTPNFEQIGPKEIEVKIWTDRGDLSITKTSFLFYLNTRSKQTFTYGPGVMEEIQKDKECVFFIQTRNKDNVNRNSGSDQFNIEFNMLKTEEVQEVEEKVEKEIKYKIKDLENGQYRVSFTPKDKGELEIIVKLLNEFDQFELIRGHPMTVKVTDQELGNLDVLKSFHTMNYLEKRLNEIQNFIQKNEEGILLVDFLQSPDVFKLLKIKEHLIKIIKEKSKIDLDLEVILQIIKSLEQEGTIKKQEHFTTMNLISRFKNLQNKTIETEKEIEQSIVQESAQFLEDIKKLEDKLKYYFIDLKQNKIYKYDIGYENAFSLIQEIENNIESFVKQIKDFEYFSFMFEFPEAPLQSKKNLEQIKTEIIIIKNVWEKIKIIKDCIEKFKQEKWETVDSNEMVEEIKQLNKKLTNIKGIDKKSNVFSSSQQEVKNWTLFLPIIGEIKDKSMNVEDDRHWKKIRQILKHELIVTDETDLRVFWDLNIYKNTYREFIEEVTEQAKQEAKIEMNLKTIQEKWVNVEFDFLEIQVLSQVIKTLKIKDEDLEVLEEQQLLIQNIAASKFMSYFEEKVLYWQKSLSNIFETITLLSDVQKNWSFLINLFITSEEVKKELPKESQFFTQIDERVKQVLKFGEEKKFVLKFCNDNYDEKIVYFSLENILQILNVCQKGLNDFITSKRKIFPRFHFLTIEELLDILANGNNPKLLFQDKNYMSKVVQAIERVIMEGTGERPKIVKFKSSVGVEDVLFCEGGMTIQGKVEIYLMDILNLVTKTIKAESKKSIEIVKTQD